MLAVLLWLLIGQTPAALSLQQVLALADENHVDEKLAELNLAQATQDRRAAYQYLLPRLDFVAQATQQYIAPQTSITTVPRFDAAGNVRFETQRADLPGYHRPDYSAGLRLTQPIFDGGRFWNAIAKGNRDLAAATAQRAEARLQVRLTVAHLFFELVRAERSLAILEVNVQRSTEQVSRAEALFEAGRGQRSDVFSARVNLANDQIAVTQARQRVDATRAALNLTIGRPADAPLSPQSADLDFAHARVTPAAVEEAAIRERPGLAALRQTLASSQYAARLARADFFPTLSLHGSYSRTSPDVELVVGNLKRQYVATGTLNLSWNLFSGGVTDVAAEKADIAIGQARVQLEKGERAVREEAHRAALNLSANLDVLGLAEQVQSTAAEALRLAEERFRAGAASNLEVRDAQLKVTSAELNLMSTRIDTELATIDVQGAIGRL